MRVCGDVQLQNMKVNVDVAGHCPPLAGVRGMRVKLRNEKTNDLAIKDCCYR